MQFVLPRQSIATARYGNIETKDEVEKKVNNQTWTGLLNRIRYLTGHSKDSVLLPDTVGVTGRMGRVGCFEEAQHQVAGESSTGFRLQMRI